MKFSRTAFLVLGLGIFIIAFAAMFSLYSGKAAENEQLNQSLNNAQGILPELLAEKEDLTSQVAQWEDKLDKAMLELSQSEGQFPKTVESIEYDEVIFRLAGQSDLLINKLVVSEPSEEAIKGTDIVCEVTTIEVVLWNVDKPPVLAGDYEMYVNDMVDKVLEFIHLVATTPDFGVATIKAASIEGLEPPEEPDGSETGPEVNIKLAIYAFPR